MKNNRALYGKMLATVGAFALAVILLSFFLGCGSATKMENIKVDTQPTLTKQPPPKAKPDASQQIVKNILDSTVRLVLKNAEGKSLKIGSGFFVRPSLIATNLYVVEGANSGYAKLVGKDAGYRIEDITRNEEHGLALLKVTSAGVKPLSLDNSDTIQYGSPIYVVKYSPEFKGLSQGIATYRSVDNSHISVASGGTVVLGNKIIRGPYLYQGNIEWIGLTTQIPREYSGGPVLNSKGKVIGVSAHRGLTSGQTGNFAITSKTLEDLLRLQ